MPLLIAFGILFFNIIYFFIKLCPTKNKITFISRQSNNPSVDIKLLKKEIIENNSDINVVVLCKKIEKGIKKKILYVFHMFKQMYHIATSKVVVLDSYCITVSILKHKKRLCVIQMWHAMGSLKKFGKSIIGKGESSVDIKGVNKVEMKDLTKLMRMHKNYDYIFASSKDSIKGFSDAFGYPEEKFKIFPQPRVDLIISSDNQLKVKKKIFNKYKILNSKNKKNILYCPTFRKDKSDYQYIRELINKIDYNKYNLILKLHPLTKLKPKDNRVIIDNSFTTYEMGFVSDYIITDYSAVIYELSLLNKPMYFYSYDLDSYVNKRDFYLNYEKDMPGIVSSNLNRILKSIEDDRYDLSKINRFNNKYITIPNNGCTKEIVKFILKKM